MSQSIFLVPRAGLPLLVELEQFLLILCRREVYRVILYVCDCRFTTRVEVLVICLVVSVDIGFLADKVVEVESNLELRTSINGTKDHDQIDNAKNDASNI